MSRLSLVGLDIGRPELNRLRHVIRSRWVTMGPQVEEFERRFATFIGVRHAVAVNSGTAALQVALAERGLKPGDEVITTPFTWESSATAILYAGGTPVFADVDPHTFNLTPATIAARIGRRTRGIVVVHYAGMPCDMRGIRALARRHRLFVIEDSAHAVGSSQGGVRCGALGDAGCFSFGSTKVITTGEGGMITTDDDRRAARYRLLRNYGETIASYDKRRLSTYAFDIVTLSYNFKMNELGAAIGVAQLGRIAGIVRRRQAARRRWLAGLASLPSIVVQRLDPGLAVVPLQFACCLPVGRRGFRDRVLRALRAAGIEAGAHYPLVYRLSYFRKALGNLEGSCPTAERVSERIVTLPCHGEVTDAHVRRAVAVLKALL